MKRLQGSARTAERAQNADRPIISVIKEQLGDDDWYTPKVLKLSPVKVSVTLGKKGKGRVRCMISENEWERRSVELAIIFEREQRPDGSTFTPLHSDIDNEFGVGDAGTFTVEQIDRLVHALTVARNEAEKRGLFTPRPTPTSVEQVLAAAGSR
jgi:hypothetical protein